MVSVGLLNGYLVIIYWEDFDEFVSCFFEVEICCDCYCFLLFFVILGGVLFVIDFMLYLIVNCWGGDFVCCIVGVFFYDLVLEGCW